MNNGNSTKSRKNEIDYEKGIEDTMRNGNKILIQKMIN
jgi:hypothetical protein